MKITSKEFVNGSFIPKKFTCNGANINPEIEISDVPNGAKSLVLIMDDPDVPVAVREDRMFVHWVLFDLSPDTTKINENDIADAQVGVNTAGDNEYRGPCPPDTLHRYFFKLYALDTKLNLHKGSTKQEVEEAMDGHIVDTAVLIGLYKQEDDLKSVPLL